MNDQPIDAATFAGLQDTAGADFVAELVATFIDDEAPQMLAELRRAQAAGDADGLRRGAHSLKSNALTFGALRLGEMARALELGGMPPDTAPLDAIEAECTRAATALQELARG